MDGLVLGAPGAVQLVEHAAMLLHLVGRDGGGKDDQGHGAFLLSHSHDRLALLIAALRVGP